MGYVPAVSKSKSARWFIRPSGRHLPARLKLGEVVEINTGSATVPQQIFIRPSAKLYTMEEVAVLLYEPPQKPEYEKTLPNADKDVKKPKR
jgi:cell shape-determining protein MreC